MPARIELVPGERYGRLTVVQEDTPVVYQQASGKIEQRRYVICQCDCGETVTVLLAHLKSSHTTSCGCYRKEVINQHKMTHGLTYHPLYGIWRGIKNRCGNPNDPSYKNYGNRGITICEAWSNDFESFYNWATSSGYQDGLEIDRINNDGIYSPTNCRWVTRTVNQRNKSNNVVVEINDRTACLTEHCEALGLKYSTVYMRIYRGWGIDDALTISTVR